MPEHRKMTTCFMNGKSCIYERAIDERLERIRNGTADTRAFVIMPFNPHLDALYQWQVVPFLRQGGGKKEDTYKCDAVERADDVRQIGYIICEKICRKIQEASLVLVDLTYDNPNVFYELGISVALNKPVLPFRLDLPDPQRGENLKRYIGVSKTLDCPRFDILTGNVSDHLMETSPFVKFTGLSGTRLVVLHDGKQIQDVVRGQPLEYSFANLCKSAAGTAIEQVFDRQNVERHRDLASYKDYKVYRQIVDCDLKNVDCSQVLTELGECYCALIDTSSTCPAAYFWLGFIHAKGGFAIPINTVPSSTGGSEEESKSNEKNLPAFDIRALWHIYYEEGKPTELAVSLKNILEFVFVEKSVTVHGFWGSFGGFWSEICIMR